MAAIVHRCACGHLDSFHTDFPTKDDTRPCIAAGCDCADADPGMPEVIPTWRAASPAEQATLDPTVIEPGTVDGPGLGRLCDCEDCWRLYNTGTEAA
ncbi:hypothetical protein [Amycolatopsis sp. NPDC051128]|uniref:hypothetical protein n=1 Tax=Amycolatopsis sp. NPDC051128 TaxID=3155412 RepID=UPI00343B217E